MRIAFSSRKDCLTNKGGDTIQMLLTKKYLEKLYGLSIDIVLNPLELYNKKYDIVHLFNIQTDIDCSTLVQHAVQINSKIVLTPIYWDLKYAISYIGLTKLGLLRPRKIFEVLQSPIINLSKLFLNKRYLSKVYINNIEYILNNSSIILPNSPEELSIIRNYFNFHKDIESIVIPNAIELNSSNLPVCQPKDMNMVLQVGRISVIKNQLGVLTALMKNKDLSLYFVGKIEDVDYFKHLQKIALKRGNVYFIDEVSQTELFEYYKKAYLHVLPSFRESPGLATMEAFLYGCEIVVSNKKFAPTSYYKFDEIGHVCNPYDISTISSAIDNAFNQPKQSSVDKTKYFDFFNYENVAKMTYDAYRSLDL